MRLLGLDSSLFLPGTLGGNGELLQESAALTLFDVGKVKGLLENLDRVLVPSELLVTFRQEKGALGATVTHFGSGQELLDSFAQLSLAKQHPPSFEVGFPFAFLPDFRRLFLRRSLRRDRSAEKFRLFLVDGSQFLLERAAEHGDALPGRGSESVQEFSIDLPSFVEEALPQVELGLLDLGLYPGGELDGRLSGVT